MRGTRFYDVTLRRPDGVTKTYRASGNTRNSAKRHAMLQDGREEGGGGPYVIVAIVFAGDQR